MSYIYLAIVALVLAKLYIKWSCGWCYGRNIMSGKVVLVTGANSGIGYETAFNMARRGANVILACRDEKRGQKAVQDITSKTNNKHVTYKHLDLSSIKSIRSFVDDIKRTVVKIDVLINNAGVSGLQDKVTEDGNVHDLQVNYFGPFLLTVLLVPLVKRAECGRIIALSSILHKYGSIDLKTLNEPRKGILAPLHVYIKTKLCDVIFANELARRLSNTDITVNSVHPGHVRTNIYKHVGGAVELIMNFILSTFFKNPLEGAQTSIYLASSEEVQDVTGKFFSDCKEVAMSDEAMDRELAEKLWAYTEDVVGLTAEERL